MDYSFKQKNRKCTLILRLHFHCKLLKFVDLSSTQKFHQQKSQSLIHQTLRLTK